MIVRLFAVLVLVMSIASPALASDRWHCISTIAYGPNKGQKDEADIEVDGNIFRWIVRDPASPTSPEITDDRVGANTDAFVVGGASLDSRSVSGLGTAHEGVAVLDKRNGSLKFAPPDPNDPPGPIWLEGHCEKIKR